MSRKDSRKKYAGETNWYCHVRPGNFHLIHSKKLIFKGVGLRSEVGILEKENAFSGANCPAIILSPNKNRPLCENYILGLFNSSVIAYYLRTICPRKLGGYRRFNAKSIAMTPVRIIDETSQSEVALYEQIRNCVKQIRVLKQSETTGVKTKGSSSCNNIKELKKMVDECAYELYSVTEEEKSIIEQHFLEIEG